MRTSATNADVKNCKIMEEKKIMNTKKMNHIILAVAMVLVCVVFVPIAQGETPYDMTMCGAGTVTLVSASKELTVLSNDITGITMSNEPKKVFDNLTYHCVGVVKVEGDKSMRTAYCKFQDPDGDACVGETIQVGTEGAWKFLQGTGKWKGIKGGGKNWPISNAKPIKPGTWQGCIRATGVYELAEVGI